MVNKYMDLWLEDPENLAYKARAEKYAKITPRPSSVQGQTLPVLGQNAFFMTPRKGL